MKEKENKPVEKFEEGATVRIVRPELVGRLIPVSFKYTLRTLLVLIFLKHILIV